jgi:hypothetical protein
MKRLCLAMVCLAAFVLAVDASSALADTVVTLNAVQDLYILASDVDGVHDNDWVAVSSMSPYRNGALTFDLSGISSSNTITDAHLELYAMNYWASNYSITESASHLWKTADGAHDVSGITWNKVHGSSPIYSKSELDTLGDISLAQGSSYPGWYSSSNASASDVSLLNSLYTSGDKKISLLLNDGDGRHEWGDAESGFAARLVVTTTPSPEPSMITLLVTGLFGLLAYAWRKRK